MKSTFLILAAAAALTPATPTVAQTSTTHAVRRYHGHRHVYYRRCRRSSGRTGLLAGAGGGGLGAAALGAGPVGIVAGVVGGGLLGRHFDKKHDAAQNRRNGC